MNSKRERSKHNQNRVVPMRHGRQRESRAWPTILGALGVAVAVAVVSATSVAGLEVWRLGSTLSDNAIDIGESPGQAIPSIGDFEGGFNIMVVAVDNSPDQNAAVYGDRDGATLNDVNILIHVAGDHTSATAVSLPRDLVVPVPECTSADGETYSALSARPLNETFARGGLKCVVDTVAQLTGLDIPFAGLITFDGVVSMATAVGGVDVCISGPIDDIYTGFTVPDAGTYTLEGDQAARFLRTRHGVGDGSDLGRISSQQVFLSALVRKVQSQGTLGDPTRLFAIAEAAATHMRLSTSLANLNTMVAMAKALRTIPLDRISFVQYPGRTGVGGAYLGKVAPIESVANELFDAIRNDQAVGFTEDALGGSYGQVLDPNATAPVSPTPSEGAPSATNSPPVDPVAPPAVIEGLRGQTASQQTCAEANN